jgi:putative methionine-R-sulfoxide reductase with GAF domain/GGDEF domain-containing protein
VKNIVLFSDHICQNESSHNLLIQKTRYLRIINDLALDLLYQDTIDDVLWLTTKSAIANLELEDCVIYLVDDTGKKLLQRAAHGPKNPRKNQIKNPIVIDMGSGIVGSVAKSGQAELVSDTRQDSRYIVDDETRLSEICVPILYKDTVIGVIDSEHPLANYFTSEHLDVLTIIASLVSTKLASCLIIEEHQSNRDRLEAAETQLSLREFEIEFLLTHDFATELCNAETFLSEGETRLRNTHLTTSTPILWVIEIHIPTLDNQLYDDDNSINAFLKQVADDLRNLVDDDALVARIGRFKFSVLMDNLVCEKSTELCQQYIDHLTEVRFEYAGYLLEVGVYIGINLINLPAYSFEAELYAAVDVAEFIKLTSPSKSAFTVS